MEDQEKGQQEERDQVSVEILRLEEADPAREEQVFGNLERRFLGTCLRFGMREPEGCRASIIWDRSNLAGEKLW